MQTPSMMGPPALLCLAPSKTEELCIIGYLVLVGVRIAQVQGQSSALDLRPKTWRYLRPGACTGPERLFICTLFQSGRLSSTSPCKTVQP